MASAVEQCRIRTVVTSRAFLAKAKMEPLEGTVFSSRKSSPAPAKWRATPRAGGRPPRALRLLCRGQRTPDSLAAVIFSSGSTALPKGVMLSHYNVLSNVEAKPSFSGSAPTTASSPGCLSSLVSGSPWPSGFPLIAGCGVVYHTNPADAKNHWRTGCEIQGDAAALYPDLLLHVYPQVLQGRCLRGLRFGWWRRKTA